MDGIYIGYLTGRAGVTLLLFVIQGGDIVGVDAGTMKYDGTLARQENGRYAVTLKFVIPAGASLITGVPPLPFPTPVTFDFEIGDDFANGQVVRIDAPTGAINATFEKVRAL